MSPEAPLGENSSAESFEEKQRAALLACLRAPSAADRAAVIRKHADLLLTDRVNRLLWQMITDGRAGITPSEIRGLRHLRLELRRCRYDGLEPGLLPINATGEVEEAAAGLLEIEGDEAARQFIETHRQKLFQRSTSHLLFCSSWLYQDDWPLAHATWQRRELLESRCQEAGKAAVQEFLRRPAGVDRRRFVLAHPELLWPEVALGLQYGAEHAPDAKSLRILSSALKDYLEAAAESGVEVRPAGKGLPPSASAPTPVPLTIRSALAEVRNWEVRLQQDAQAAAPLAAASERTLAQLPPTADAAVRAALHNAAAKGYLYSSGAERAANLGRTLDHICETLGEMSPKANPALFEIAQVMLRECFEIPVADGGPNLQAAAQFYQRARLLLKPASDPAHASALHAAFGGVFLSRLAEDRDGALRRAATCFKEALRHLPEEASSQTVARLDFDLGATYQMLSLGDRTLVVRTVECFESGLSALAPAASAQQYVNAQLALAQALAELPTGGLADNLKRAIFHCDQALRICTPEFDPSVHAAFQNHLGNVLRRLGVFEGSSGIRRAISCYRKALVYRTPERAPVECAKTLNNLGLAHAVLPDDVSDNLERAIEYYDAALRICPPTADPAEYSRILTNLGIACMERPTGDSFENIRRAIACFEESRRYCGPDESPQSQAMALVNLGAALCLLEREEATRRAIQYFMRASPALEPFPREFARLQANLGAASSALRGGSNEADLRQAVDYFEKAGTAETRKDDPLTYGTIRMNLGAVHLRLPRSADHGNALRAVACLQEALSVFTPAEEHPVEYGQVMNHLGSAYAEMEDPAHFQKAIDCFKEALRFLSPDSNPSGYRETQTNLAHAYFGQGRWTEADQAYAAALEVDELLFRAGGARRVWDEQGVAYARAAFSAAEVRSASAGLQTFERGQARMLANSLRLAAFCPPGVPAEVWKVFQNAAAAARKTLNGKSNFPGRDLEMGNALAFERQETAGQAQTHLDEAIAQVRRHAPRFLKEFDLLEEACAQLEEGTALVALCVTNKGTKVFIASRKGSPRHHDLPGFKTDDLSRLVFGQTTADGSSPDGWIVSYLRRETDQLQWLATIERVLRELGRDLVGPIVAALGSEVNHVVLIGGGQLALLPLHAVWLSESPPVRLGDRYQVSYSHAAQVHGECLRRARQAHGDDFYAIVNPRDDVNLPYAAFEALAIGEQFKSKTVTAGQKATRAAFCSETRGHAYIHFAGHGHYNWLSPSQSGLELADGDLTLTDLQSGTANFSAARLVSLSACETGLVDVLKRTEEEYVGLPAGFLLAGVPCVVSSLWEVPELSTALLMQRFFANLATKQMTIPAALGAAQQWVRTLPIEAVARHADACLAQAAPRDEPKLWEWQRRYSCRARTAPDGKPFEHPYYWAAFTVNGA